MATRSGAVSGFPEFSPQQRRIEQYFLDSLRSTFELHGFASVETRAVEPLEQLVHAGETSKEVYVLQRLQQKPGSAGSRSWEHGTDDSCTIAGWPASTLGLHFDMTVPFARYVAERSGELVFPFRRYQIQKAWRGERPQEGRYREFTQADIDIVGQGQLPASAEVETVLVAADALQRLPLPSVRIRVNNRKVAEGFYTGLGLEHPATILRIVDKLDKIGPQAVQQLLQEAGATSDQAQACVQLATINSTDARFTDQVKQLGVRSDLLDEGLHELSLLIEQAGASAPGLVQVDLSVARGLDYYTGAVFETTMAGFESLGSVCSGGRYDNLVSIGNQPHPGVGISIGVTRLLGPLLAKGRLHIDTPTATKVLVAVVDEASRGQSQQIATALRARGIPTQVSGQASKFGKQIRYADRIGIPYVWFPPAALDHKHGDDHGDDPGGAVGGDASTGLQQGANGEVRDVRTGQQIPADPRTWPVPAADQVHLVPQPDLAPAPAPEPAGQG